MIVDVFWVRMGRVNITLPDDVLAEARAAGLNVSRLAAGALRDELDRQAKMAALESYPSELASEFGHVPDEERLEAQNWVSRVLAAAPTRASSAQREGDHQ